jgi:hypothetical protein
MMESIKFTFELIDQFTGKARKITASLDSIDKSAKKASKSAASWGKSLSEGLGSVSSAIKFGGGIIAAVSALSVVGGKFAADAMDFRDGILTAYQALGETKENSRAIFDRIRVLGDKTAFSTEQMAQAITGFRQQGMRQDVSEKLALAVSDIASVAVDKNLKLEQLQTMITKTSGMGFLSLDALGESKITVPVLTAIAKSKNLTADQVHKLIAAKKLGTRDLAAALTSLATNDGKRALGEVSEQIGLGTIGGQIESLKGQIKGIFYDEDSKPFVEDLKQVNSWLASALPTLKALGGEFSNAFMPVIDSATWLIGDMIKTFGGWPALAKRVGSSMRVIGTILGVVFGAGALLVYGFVEAINALSMAIEWIASNALPTLFDGKTYEKMGQWIADLGKAAYDAAGSVTSFITGDTAPNAAGAPAVSAPVAPNLSGQIGQSVGNSTVANNSYIAPNITMNITGGSGTPQEQAQANASALNGTMRNLAWM